MRELGVLIERHGKEQEIRDWRAGMIAATIANVHRDPKRNPHPYQPRDFMPQYQKGDSQPEHRQTPEEMEMIIMQWNAALGGEDRRYLN